VRSLPPAAYTRVPVFVHAEVVDAADSAARPAVDALAAEVARRTRARVWPTAAAAAAAESAGATGAGRLDPRLAGARVGGAAAAARGGPARRALAWAAPTADPGLDPALAGADTAAAALLAQALGDARGAGAGVPDAAVRGDSLPFELRLAHPEVRGRTRVWGSVPARGASGVFSLAVPWRDHAQITDSHIDLRYPAAAQRRGRQGALLLEFVVGADGRVEDATVRASAPPASALAPGVPAVGPEDPDGFAAAARRAVVGARWLPAFVGGCPVRERIALPLAFTLSR
jgi:outer membrane biosynthesis protein TonB